MDIFESINLLVGYALQTNLIESEDVIFTQNRLLEIFDLDGFESDEQAQKIPTVKVEQLEQILKSLNDYAVEKKLIENDSVVYRDLFDTKLMGALISKPSEIQKKFFSEYKKSPEDATNWYYKFSQDTDYIRRYRICKDVKWISKTDFGDLDITINLSKPEKDPKAIAAALNVKKSGYPPCLLCKENEGYKGRVNHAARQNHRIIPLTLNNSTWYLQYSPYVYYNEHCIVFSEKHIPMKISTDTFCALFDFVKQFPHYTIGSNADLPIVGGSILTHNHFQGGNYEFAMARAPIETEISFNGFKNISAGIVKWPMSVIRLDGENAEELILLAEKILSAWRGYNDEDSFIFSETNGEPHNTITPIARMRKKGNINLYELDLVLRNNITTDENPLGVFHPHADLHHIKKENIGLIEVMGLAVLPARLKQELSDLGKAIVEKKNFKDDEILGKHFDWVQEFLPNYNNVTTESIEKILQDEVGKVFSRVLSDAGVFKNTDKGKKAFLRFVGSVKV